MVVEYNTLEMNEIEKIKEYRLLVLRKAYRITGGNVGHSFHDYRLFEDINKNITVAQTQSIINYLLKKDLIEVVTKDGVYSLTIDGLEYVEEDILCEGYLSDSEIDLLDDKFDQVLEKLHKLELGQEIIFNELEELKFKSRTFSKSDFKKIVIGSIFSMTTKEVISSQLAKQILETIFDLDNFKLLQ